MKPQLKGMNARTHRPAPYRWHSHGLPVETHDGSTFLEVGASGKPGVVHGNVQTEFCGYGCGDRSGKYF